MKGNEDRRGGGVDHAEHLAALRQAADRAEGSAALATTSLRDVIEWVDRTGLTGYYQTERNRAAQALRDARDAVHVVTDQLDQALAAMQRVP